ncbi:MAG: ArnT family glycosyltransferase [Marmoricola sp.]
MSDGTSSTRDRAAFAAREVGVVASAVGVLLVALAGRYGYHRDELYFLQAGRHLAWGYPDQPPLVPLVAHVMDTIAPGSLVVLRLPSALAATAIVVIAGLIARELGARRSGQVVAAASTGLSGVVLGTGHLLSTATISMLGWACATLLLVRLLQGTSGLRDWWVLGALAGATMQANLLIVALVAALGVAVLVVGPRELFARAGPYLAVLVAAVVVAPYVVWQAAHGFPQVHIADSIANGGSGSSQSRWAFLPFQLLQQGPPLAPLWITGLVVLLRDRTLRVLGLTYLVLAVLFLVAGGKPYYLSGLYPLLLAAGAQPFLDRVRSWVVPVLLVASLPTVVIVLPVLPAHDENGIVALNYDAGETIGWPAYVDQVAAVYRTLPAGTAILTGNYGEAGAVDRYGGSRGLPAAYSGHMGFWFWGPPPGSVPVLAIGIDPVLLSSSCASTTVVGKLHEVHGIENDEDGTPLVLCSAPRRPWAGLWKRFERH